MIVLEELLSKKNIVRDVSPMYECGLSFINEPGKNGTDSVSNHLADTSLNGVTVGNWSIFIHIGGIVALRDQGDRGTIQFLEEMA